MLGVGGWGSGGSALISYLLSASLWVDMRRWLLRSSWPYVSVVGSPGAWKSYAMRRGATPAGAISYDRDPEVEYRFPDDEP